MLDKCSAECASIHFIVDLNNEQSPCTDQLKRYRRRATRILATRLAAHHMFRLPCEAQQELQSMSCACNLSHLRELRYRVISFSFPLVSFKTIRVFHKHTYNNAHEVTYPRLMFIPAFRRKRSSSFSTKDRRSTAEAPRKELPIQLQPSPKTSSPSLHLPTTLGY